MSEGIRMGSRFAGKVAVITGSARGLGAATASLLVQEGGSVVVADVGTDLGKDLVQRLGDAAHFVECDVTQEAQVARAVQAGEEQFGRLDAVFANAGIMGPTSSISDLNMSEFDKTISINLRGSLTTAKQAAIALLKQRQGGAIVMMSSCGGLQGGLSPHAYTASKAAIVGLARSLSAELISHGIRVNAIAPGPIPSPMTSLALTGATDQIDEASRQIGANWSPTGRAPTTDAIAEAFLFLASDAGSHISGVTLPVDGGLVNGSPTGAVAALGASMMGADAPA